MPLLHLPHRDERLCRELRAHFRDPAEVRRNEARLALLRFLLRRGWSPSSAISESWAHSAANENGRNRREKYAVKGFAKQRTLPVHRVLVHSPNVSDERCDEDSA
jgi:predicted component of type VI protein secretion system